MRGFKNILIFSVLLFFVTTMISLAFAEDTYIENFKQFWKNAKEQGYVCVKITSGVNAGLHYCCSLRRVSIHDEVYHGNREVQAVIDVSYCDKAYTLVFDSGITRIFGKGDTPGMRNYFYSNSIPIVKITDTEPDVLYFDICKRIAVGSEACINWLSSGEITLK